MSLNSKKFHTCLHCRNKGRGVDFYPLMGGYYHYECWLELGRDNLMFAFTRRGSDSSVLTPAKKQNQLDLFILDRSGSAPVD